MDRSHFSTENILHFFCISDESGVFMKNTILLFCLICMAPCLVAAQATESATHNVPSLAVGAEFSIFNPDYYCPSSSPFNCGNGLPLMESLGVYVDNRWLGNLGSEEEARWLRWNGLGGQQEATYLIGPRFRVYRWHKLGVWPKFLVGIGNITTAGYPGPNTFKGNLFVYVPGASLDYRLSRRLSIRGDYELVKWPGFSVSAAHDNGLSPNGFSFGVACAIFDRREGD
jgi:hypothetical protein